MVLRRLLTAFLIALLISGTCTLLLVRKLTKGHAAMVKYVTVTRDLDAGEVLRPTDLKVTNWPSNAPISGAAQNNSDAVGRAVLSPLAAGEPVLLKSLSALGGVGLSAKIPDGMRAISLKSDQIVGVSGFLLPGSHTDVLVTYHNPGETNAVTATVLQNAEVIAAGQKTQPDPDGKPSTVDVVTLLVSPNDAERVVLASSQGTVHFVLRNGSDQQQTTASRTDMAALGLAPQLRPADTEPRPTVTEAHTVKKVNAVKRPASQVAKAQAGGYQIVVVRGDKQSVETF